MTDHIAIYNTFNKLQKKAVDERIWNKESLEDAVEWVEKLSAVGAYQIPVFPAE